MRKLFSSCLLGLILLSTPARAAQQAQQNVGAKPQTAEEQLKERAKVLYEDILKGDRLAALELVAPDSKNQFLNTRYDGLVDYRIVSVEIAPSGGHGTVKVGRQIRAPNFTKALEVNVIDTWQLVNGQWFFVLPPPGEMDTPFGKIKFDPNAKPSDAEVQEMKQRIENSYKNVDPDQYIRVLQKATDGSSSEAKPAGKPANSDGTAAKPETKKPTESPPPADSSKPQT